MMHSSGQKLYSVADLARAAGADYSVLYVKVRYSKTLPGPDVAHGHRRYYSELLYNEVVAECLARILGGHDAK